MKVHSESQAQKQHFFPSDSQEEQVGCNDRDHKQFPPAWQYRPPATASRDSNQITSITSKFAPGPAAAEPNIPLQETVALFVGNLSASCRDEDLIEAFSCHSSVVCVRIMKTRKGTPLGYAFVTVSCMGDAENVLKLMDKTPLCGRTLHISIATKNVLDDKPVVTRPKVEQTNDPIKLLMRQHGAHDNDSLPPGAPAAGSGMNVQPQKSLQQLPMDTQPISPRGVQPLPSPETANMEPSDHHRAEDAVIDDERFQGEPHIMTSTTASQLSSTAQPVTKPGHPNLLVLHFHYLWVNPRITLPLALMSPVSTPAPRGDDIRAVDSRYRGGVGENKSLKGGPSATAPTCKVTEETISRLFGVDFASVFAGGRRNTSSSLLRVERVHVESSEHWVSGNCFLYYNDLESCLLVLEQMRSVEHDGVHYMLERGQQLTVPTDSDSAPNAARLLRDNLPFNVHHVPLHRNRCTNPELGGCCTILEGGSSVVSPLVDARITSRLFWRIRCSYYRPHIVPSFGLMKPAQRSRASTNPASGMQTNLSVNPPLVTPHTTYHPLAAVVPPLDINVIPQHGGCSSGSGDVHA